MGLTPDITWDQVRKQRQEYVRVPKEYGMEWTWTENNGMIRNEMKVNETSLWKKGRKMVAACGSRSEQLDTTWHNTAQHDTALQKCIKKMKNVKNYEKKKWKNHGMTPEKTMGKIREDTWGYLRNTEWNEMEWIWMENNGMIGNEMKVNETSHGITLNKGVEDGGSMWKWIRATGHYMTQYSTAWHSTTWKCRKKCEKLWNKWKILKKPGMTPEKTMEKYLRILQKSGRKANQW